MGLSQVVSIAREAQHDGAVLLTGEVLRPMSVSLDDLEQLGSVLVDPFDLRCFTTRRLIRTVAGYRGVLLKELITAAGLRNAATGDFKRTIFVASAHDGYAVTFSWRELFNTPIGEQAIVAYECGGEPLSAADGAPILYSGADIFSAARHVKRIAKIDTRVLGV
ncbi:molybdopterin-dependent oxidoreductase [Paraburkholderia sp. ZP32-5]|uniref:molybdopterin-dependent oxidoreductase n=1 Tax=Paraburkholderia sp. ZP32-5 TaxID=2883245 RepID=UPI001F2C9365|nr:molybdopterin-dependent oxidoreductase [Paraburkholderia sp. ZP32-5]